MKREARIIRYYKDKDKTTEDDYIECLLKCWDPDKKKYYWGMSWRWDYKSMLKFAEHNPAHDIAEDLFQNLWKLQYYDYKVRYESKCIDEKEEVE